MRYRVTFKVHASVTVEYEVEAENFQAAAVAAHDLMLSENVSPSNVKVETLYRDTAQFDGAVLDTEEPLQKEDSYPWIVKFYESAASDSEAGKVSKFLNFADAEAAASEVVENPTGRWYIAKVFQVEQGVEIWAKSVTSPRHGWEVEVLDASGNVIHVESGLNQAQAAQRFRHYAFSAAGVNLVDFTNRNDRKIVKRIA